MALEFSIDLALENFSSLNLNEIKGSLPDGYLLNKVKWGALIEKSAPNTFVKTCSNDLSGAMNEFLAPIGNMTELLVDGRAIIRVAIYSTTYTTTLKLSDYKMLEQFRAELEISVYPTNEDA